MRRFAISYRYRLVAAVSLACVGLSACSSSSPEQQGASENRLAWPTEQQAAQGTPPTSDVASRLTVWLGLVKSSQNSAQAYADFLQTRPVWPRWQLLRSRMQLALAKETDPAVLARLCATQNLTYGPALAQCATQVPASADLSKRLNTEAAQAWVNGNDASSAATALQSNFASAITPERSWLRFDREEKNGLVAAAKQTLPYLSAQKQPLAQARLAFRADDPAAETLAAALPANQRSDPYLILDHARWLRKQQRYDEAVALWKSAGVDAERSTHGASFWRERDTLARELIQAGRAADAFAVANDTATTPTNRLDAQFLSGWIALRLQHDPATAETFFRPLAQSSALITRSRGFYWLGRARAAAGDSASAHANWQQAAALPGTFYGQMAAAALEGRNNVLLDPANVPEETRTRLKAERDPETTTSEDVYVSGSELAQAAQILVSWGDRPHARDFMNMLEQQVTSTPQRLALSSLSAQLGLPDIAVTVSRHAGRDGVFLLRSGWPLPYTPPSSTLPAGVALGLMRQESNFNPDAVSPSNAIGLMQLKPSTAGDMLRVTGLPASAATAAGLHDPENNMRLGTAYLEHIQSRFGAVVPYMAAAYNGGPTRLARWLSTAGNPAQNGASAEEMIDWIESIPYSETRNYVQRVWENMTIYVALGSQ
ncbi:soluble lytic murein transglycosylase [Acetobacter pasteurianus NBRC 101655]|uniref:lytic transglycosylase domain-containing protein n=1 Tax=Acetobacter pasteurianus TaxID=438 RepID=UPI00038441BD|nr:lytic transglycosylase domain-containing protein [Acetobacter pasteurianus]BAU38236.1 soluble lytic murein transglycosylase [Acetobacter pasteurianus NBRC 101655]CCT60761.1 soluble lytic murein transglycosylase [Acetobacter pasteurianus 386B]